MIARPALLLLAALAACAEPPPDLVIVARRDAVPGTPAAIVGGDVRDGAIGDRDELFVAPASASIVDAAISDDRRWLAFATDSGSEPGVFVVDAHARRRTKISDEPLVDRLVFAPPAEALIFDVRRLATEPEAVRFVAPLVDGVGTPVQAQDEAAETTLPSFADDSDTMVFVDSREGGNALVVVHALAHASVATIAM